MILMLYFVLKLYYSYLGIAFILTVCSYSNVDLAILLTMLSYFADDIIKRKLLIEGDGGNDDRRINSLLKTFIKWCNSSESAEERFCFCNLLLLLLIRRCLTLFFNLLHVLTH